jgi:hypothetical protein
VKKHLRNTNYIPEGSKTTVAFNSTHTEKVSISSQMAVYYDTCAGVIINYNFEKQLFEKIY